MSAIELTPFWARKHILEGTWPGPARVPGRLELRGLEAELPEGLHCYELDLCGSSLRALPASLRVDSRLTLDDSPLLERLPEGLTAGSISLRQCPALTTLPEGLDTWFLDLTGCTAFHQWPRRGTLQRGSLVLRGCVSVSWLPDWIGRLSQLDLAGCVGLTSLPEGLEVTSWVDVGGSGLTGLPASLRGAPLRWRGVRIDERIAFHPDEITAREALAEQNAERRRVLIERMGYLRFLQEAEPTVLDEDRDPGGARQLLRIELAEDEPLVGLACSCPSTGRRYLIRVPPATKNCHQAAAWIAGFDDPEQYRPGIET